jgi:hypothetical protein
MRACLLILLAAYVAIDLRAVRIWRSELTLWTHAERVAPCSGRSVFNFAQQRFVLGDDAGVDRLLQRLRDIERGCWSCCAGAGSR